jgi:hypothetical protein
MKWDDLPQIRIASPCPAKWEEMEGDDRIRHCSLCQLNVYNFTAMSSEEVRDVLKETEGHLCVRMYQRQDGRAMASDCKRPLDRAKKRFAYYVGTGCMILLGGLASAGNTALSDPYAKRPTPVAILRGRQPFKAVFDWFDPPQEVPMGSLVATTGKMATDMAPTAVAVNPDSVP